MARHPFQLAAALGLAALLILGASCSSKPKAPPLRKVNGRTILMDSSDPAPSPEYRAEAARRRPDLVTRADDERVGAEAAKDAAAQMGLLGDEALDAYVTEVGRRLLKGLPRRSYRYEFRVIDQWEPNAFALPGGYIFISRGLLALANNEDELANVIGHEIIHAQNRHSARAQAADRFESRLSMGWVRAKNQAAYSRDMEREADAGGQILAGAAGYDPVAMSTLQASLGQMQMLMSGKQRFASFFDTHPGTNERVTATALRAAEIRWTRDPELGDTHLAHLSRINGLPVGERPEAGVFEGQRFLHPDLDFQLRFPDGWNLINTPQQVGAMSPRRDAVVFLSAGGPAGDPRAAAEKYVAEARDQDRLSVSVLDQGPLKLAGAEAWRIEVLVSDGRQGLNQTVTFFPYGQAMWSITGMVSSLSSSDYHGRFVSTARSFRPLSPEQRARIEGTNLEIVTTRPAESVVDLVERTGSAWNSSEVGVVNALDATQRFEGGESVKVAKKHRYQAEAAE